MSITATANAAATPDALVASLRRRYAVKKFDPAGQIPAAVWTALEEALVLSPSSYGLQPWKFFVVENPALRAKLKSASWEQTQITDAHKLVVFAVKKDFGAADVERFIERIAEVRRLPKEALESYKKMMLASASLPPEKVAAWLIRQVYIALGVFLSTAAALGVDACPMEGFDKDKYDEILGLTAKGYNAVVVATAGVRAADDAAASQLKVRFPKTEVIETL
ncbi:MAG: NAD(P)H-dependent oxidoreductase [Elusimicrobia bacterium]|nr:NAD(P)H-dependent oxidoreductase [Elusimicrobiota bacterium]MDE2511975.1 NAD(P)H-dependent oxidoreductase [Elusimicrobiota bacterium]